MSEQVNKIPTLDNVTYIISSNIDLEGGTERFGKDSVIVFRGGSISNGTIIGDNTTIIGTPTINAQMQGSWRQMGDNLPKHGRRLGSIFYQVLRDRMVFWDGEKWKYLNGYDASIPNLGTTLPTIPTGTNAGFVFYKTNEGKYLIWTGTEWKNADGYDNISHIGSNLPNMSSGDNAGFTFYNTTDNNYYLWDGSAWQILHDSQESLIIAAAFNYIDAKIESIQKSFVEGLPYLKVQELMVARKVEAYPKDGNLYLVGSGAPSMVPQFNGQEYFDSTNNRWYKAGFTTTNPTTSAWKQITN